jgi:hypothetical protein
MGVYFCGFILVVFEFLMNGLGFGKIGFTNFKKKLVLTSGVGESNQLL